MCLHDEPDGVLRMACVACRWGGMDFKRSKCYRVFAFLARDQSVDAVYQGPAEDLVQFNVLPWTVQFNVLPDRDRAV